MSDEPNSPDSRALKWPQAIALAYVVIVFIAQLTGLLRRVVPPPYRMLVLPVGVALFVLAFRPRGPKGWLSVIVAAVLIACWIYDTFPR
jgi:hypothetical protein